MTARPRHGHATRRRRRETKNERPARRVGHVGGGLAIDEQVRCVQMKHIFAEGHFDLRQVQHRRPGWREERGHHGRHDIDEVVKPVGTGRGVIEGVRRRGLIRNCVARRPADLHRTVGRLGKGEGHAVARDAGAVHGETVDEKIIRVHAADRLGERDRDGSQIRDRTGRGHLAEDDRRVRLREHTLQRGVEHNVAAAQAGVENLDGERVRPAEEIAAHAG